MIENREIRFIDPEYNELFRIPDGGRIVVTRPMGEMYPGVQEEWIGTCRFLDETHVNINGECYHICQFAEIWQRIGAAVLPENEREYIGSYTVNRRTFVGDKIFKLGHNPDAAEPYGTWMCFRGENERNSFGHYFTDKRAAEKDFFLRAECERRQVPYDHTKLVKDSSSRDNGAR
jgi:hypothetical protein